MNGHPTPEQQLAMRTEAIVQDMIGKQMTQVAVLMAQNEALRAENATLGREIARLRVLANEPDLVQADLKLVSKE